VQHQRHPRIALPAAHSGHPSTTLHVARQITSSKIVPFSLNPFEVRQHCPRPSACQRKGRRCRAVPDWHRAFSQSKPPGTPPPPQGDSMFPISPQSMRAEACLEATAFRMHRLLNRRFDQIH
jgi:hypothetical protein